MGFQVTTSTRKIAALRKRVRIIAGGTSAGKTISVLMVLIDMAQSDKTPTLTSVVSSSFPHLRRGSLRDFQNIMQTQHYWKDDLWNASTMTYTFETGSKLEFFSADQPGKVRGPRRDRLFVNECNLIVKESWDQLLLRTRQLAIADFNPVGNFFLYDDYLLDDKDGIPTAGDEDADFLILTYKDNESLEDAIVREIEKRRINKSWFDVYGRGIRGEMEGKIFKGWTMYDDLPPEARLEARGLDFGYAQDPAVLVDIYKYNGAYIVDEITYRTGMLNRHLADLINNQPDPNVLTIADSAEPKSIAEMQEYGVNIIGVEKKGVGGVNFTNSAIQFVQEQRMGMTRRSVNLRKSYDQFMWQVDKEGVIIPKYDHFMSDGMMAIIYGMTSFAPREVDTAESYTSGNFVSSWY